MKRLVCLLLLTLLLAGCGAEAGQTQPATTLPPTEETLTPEDTGPGSLADRLLGEMTLREKVGQLFIVTPDALLPEQAPVTAFSGELALALEDYPVGGVILFADNIVDSRQLLELNLALRAAGEIPMFLSVDEEGGSVARLANHRSFNLPRYDSARAVGASANPADAFEMGSTIGSYLRRHGFNMNFAPVADVDTNPRNPVIGSRAFSDDPETVAKLARAMAQGLGERDIIAVYKHFPGHGDTAEDSHTSLALSWKTAEELRACEWIPFTMADSTDCVMVGHIALPNVTGDRTPATMSEQIVTGILRGELGFSGLIITDSLSMGAITERYIPAEAAVGALLAGCDLLLMPEHLEAAFDGVIEAICDGVLSEETLDQTVVRILEFKIRTGLIPEP